MAKKEAKKPKDTATTEVPLWVKDELVDAKKHFKLTEKVLVGHVLEWFARLRKNDKDKSGLYLQAQILGRVTEDLEADFARMVLQKMANEPDAADDSSGGAAGMASRTAARRTSSQQTRSSKKRRSNEAG